MGEISMRKRVLCLIAATFILRCLLAGMVHLGNDEAYYFTYALQPDWNHFDHPPLVGIFIRIFTLNLSWVNDLSMRLTAIASAGAGTWLIYKSGALLKNERTGWIAAVLYNTSIYTSIISGLFILPDSPQLVFWLLALLTALKLLLDTDHRKDENRRLILIGLYIGLATMCKVHGIFLWFGFGAYIIFHDRKYLGNVYLYLAFILTILIISPIFFWNLQNNFITWHFHSQRVEIHHAVIDWSGFITATLGQLLYNNPFNIVLYILGFRVLKKVHFPKKSLSLLSWMAFPLIIATTAISLFRTVLPHWSGPGFIPFMLITAFVPDMRPSGDNPHVYRRWLNAASVLIIILVILAPLVINFYPGTLGDKRPKRLGKGDFTLDMYGWTALRQEFKTLRTKDLRSGVMTPTAPIITDKWFPGGHILFYVGYPLHIPVVGVGSLYDLHKFAWLNRMEGYILKGADAYYITSSDSYEDPGKRYDADFKNITLAERIPAFRSGRLVRYWYIYRLKGALHQLGNILPYHAASL